MYIREVLNLTNRNRNKVFAWSPFFDQSVIMSPGKSAKRIKIKLYIKLQIEISEIDPFLIKIGKRKTELF